MYLKSYSYKELIVWQKSAELMVGVYNLTAKFPKEDPYSLAAQMKRAAISIPSNIAEGSRRKDAPEYLQFLKNNRCFFCGSGDTACYRKASIPNIAYDEACGLLEEVQKMLNGMMIKLATKSG